MDDRDVRFCSTFGQNGPKWDKSGTFKDQFQYILAFWMPKLKSLPVTGATENQGQLQTQPGMSDSGPKYVRLAQN